MLINFLFVLFNGTNIDFTNHFRVDTLKNFPANSIRTFAIVSTVSVTSDTVVNKRKTTNEVF